MTGTRNIKDRTPYQEIVVYIVLWLLVILVPIILAISEVSELRDIRWHRVFRWWIGIIPFFVLFLIHRLLIVPHLLFRNRIWTYVGVVILSTGLLSVCKHEIIGYPPPPPHIHDSFRRPSMKQGSPPPDLMPSRPSHPDERSGPPSSLLPYMMDGGAAFLMLGLSLAVVLLFKSQRETEMRVENERLRLHSELKYLRSQVNPHFFMNMLNTIHALVEMDPPKAQKMIIGLSKLMRYTLYQADRTSAYLVDEVKFLENYIEIMRVRYPDDIVSIDLTVPQNYTDNIKIPPLLFMPLIENAFKHGVSYLRSTSIVICVEENDGNIHFFCQNTCSNGSSSKDKPDGGIGLQNVRRRINLLYGESATFEVYQSEENFTVELKIPSL